MEFEPRNPVWKREPNSRRFIYSEIDRMTGVKTIWFRNPITLVHGREDTSSDNSLKRTISRTDDQSILPFSLEICINHVLERRNRRLSVADLTDGERIWNFELRYEDDSTQEELIATKYSGVGALAEVILMEFSVDPNEKILEAWDFYESKSLEQNLGEVIKKFKLFGEHFLAGSSPESPEDDIEINYGVATVFSFHEHWSSQHEEEDRFITGAVYDLIDRASVTWELDENERGTLFKWIHIKTLRRIPPEFPFADFEAKQRVVETAVNEAVADILAEDEVRKEQEFDTTVTFKFDRPTALPLSYIIERGGEGNQVTMGEGSVNLGDIVTVGQSIYKLDKRNSSEIILEVKSMVENMGCTYTIPIRIIDIDFIESLMTTLEPSNWQRALESIQIQVSNTPFR